MIAKATCYLSGSARRKRPAARRDNLRRSYRCRHVSSSPHETRPFSNPGHLKLTPSFPLPAQRLSRSGIMLRPIQLAVLLAHRPCVPATDHRRPAVPPTHRHGLHSSHQAILLIAGPFPERSPRGHSRHATMRHGSHPVAPQIASRSSPGQAKHPLSKFRLDAAGYAFGSRCIPPSDNLGNRRGRHPRHRSQRSAANSRSLIPHTDLQDCQPRHATPIPARSYPPQFWPRQAGLVAV